MTAWAMCSHISSQINLEMTNHIVLCLRCLLLRILVSTSLADGTYFIRWTPKPGMLSFVPGLYATCLCALDHS